MPDALAPVLEMLGEADDPSRVLASRFGFGTAAAAAEWVTELLRRRWDIAVQQCDRIVMSDCNALAWVRSSSGRLIVKWGMEPERFARLRDIAQLTLWLAERDVPVSEPITALDGQSQVETDAVSVAVQRVIPATLLDANDPAQVHAAGAALARLHDALAGYPGRIVGTETPAPLPDQIRAWLAASGDRVPENALEALHRMVSRAPRDALPTQLVHGDIRSANVLMSGTSVTAFLDFEELRIEAPVVELARSAVLLGTRFHDWGPVPADTWQTLRAGYESVRPLSDAEARWWRILLLWVTIAMIPPGDDPTGWTASAQTLVEPLHER